MVTSPTPGQMAYPYYIVKMSAEISTRMMGLSAPRLPTCYLLPIHLFGCVADCRAGAL